MTHRGENLTIMDATATIIEKKNVVPISKLSVVLLALFISCMVLTGGVVYYLTASQTCSTESAAETANGGQAAPHINGTSNSTTVGPFAPETTTAAAAAAPATTPSASGEAASTDTSIGWRLPRSIRPHSYKIKLIPFIEEGNFTFHGNVGVLINVSQTTNNVTLHANDLIIDRVEVLHSKTGRLVPVKEIANDTKRQFLVIFTAVPIRSGEQYYVTVAFRGFLNDMLRGFYKSSYRVGNETRWIAATQFQATDARRAFPCFDEPALKARFQISLARRRTMTTISNMARRSEGDAVVGLPDYVWDHYQESLPMSTYLLAFVVSDFEKISDGRFSVWARKSAISQTKYSLELGSRILKFYEGFFGIEFPLSKIDMVALPDFSAGAMENWGLITYRESYLLFDEGATSRRSKQGIAHVIAHELAHQWFGNLVTPYWWTDLWLNEGFATFVEFLGADSVNPQLKELDQYIMALQQAFDLDALKSSHQISVEVNNPDEIDDIFDTISYAKGAAILRMMQHFMGFDVFKRGVHRYLKENMYKNAKQDDLWRALTLQCQEDGVLNKSVTIKQIMASWTLQIGYPVVTALRNYENQSVTFQQHRFLLQKDSKVTSSVLWWIPLTFAGPKSKVRSTWLTTPLTTVEDTAIPASDWMLVNLNQTGYYRVNYDERNWRLIIKQLTQPGGHLAFDPKNRAQLINDAMNLASAGYIGYDIALGLVTYLKQERDFVPWKVALGELNYLYEMFVRTVHFDKLKAFLQDLIYTYYKQLRFYDNPDENELSIANRVQIYQKACQLGLKQCTIESFQLFENWRNSPNPDQHNMISTNLRYVVYCTAVSVGGEEEWNFLWRRFLNTNVAGERETLMMSLGCTREVWLLSRYLEWAIMENSGIRKQDMGRVFASVANNVVGRDLAYRFIKTNWNRIVEYVDSTITLNGIVASCASKFTTLMEINDFKLFLENSKKNSGISLRTAQQSIEQSESNLKWMEQHYNNIVKWLSKYY